MKKYLLLILSIINLIGSIIFLVLTNFINITLQWDANNIALVTKPWYFFLFLALFCVILAILGIFIEKFSKIFNFFVIAIVFYTIIAILYNLDFNISTPFIMITIIEILYLVSALKIRKSNFGDKFAINLQYLLDNENAWSKTQKFASNLIIILASISFIVNLLFLFGILSLNYSFFVLLIGSFITLLIIVKRSYRYLN